MAWILTPAAIEDIDHIVAEGARQFGLAQAIRYELELLDKLDGLAMYPYRAAAQDVDGLGLRLVPHGRHHILYVVENEDVVIVRILHALQNWPDLL